MNPVSDLRKLADWMIETEQNCNWKGMSFFNAHGLLQARAEELSAAGIPAKIEFELLDLLDGTSRIHFRLVTPDMEVTDDVPANARKAALRPVTGQAAG